MTEERRTLADLRKQRGITQDELSAQTGVAWATIAKLELGKHEPTLYTLKELAKVLGNEVLDVDYGWDRPPRKRQGRPRKSTKRDVQSEVGGNNE